MASFAQVSAPASPAAPATPEQASGIVQVRVATDDDRAEMEGKVRAAQERAEAERGRADVEHQRAAGIYHAAIADQRAQAETELANALEAEKLSARAAGAGATFTFTGKTEKASFLGVSTSQIQPAMSSQLKLAKGVGLVVESADKDGPAGQAGLEQYDVMYKIDDQILVNPQQLAVLVRMHKPGDTVSLTVYRGGDEKTIKAKLIEKEVAALENDVNLFPPAVWQGAPRAAFGGAMGGAGVAPNVFQLRGGQFKANVLNGFKAGKIHSGVAISKDDQGTIEISVKDGEKNLRAEDKNGKEIFKCPIQTDEQRKTLPGGLLARLEKFEAKLKEMGVTPGEEGGAIVTVRGHNLKADDDAKDETIKDKTAKEKDATEKSEKRSKKSDSKDDE